MEPIGLLRSYLEERLKFDELLEEAFNYPQHSIIRHISFQNLVSQTKISHFYFEIIYILLINLPLEYVIPKIWEYYNWEETINCDKSDYHDKLAFFDVFVNPNLKILEKFPEHKKLNNIVKFLQQVFCII